MILRINNNKLMNKRKLLELELNNNLKIKINNQYFKKKLNNLHNQ